jgi:hypothetical protein
MVGLVIGAIAYLRAYIVSRHRLGLEAVLSENSIALKMKPVRLGHHCTLDRTVTGARTEVAAVVTCTASNGSRCSCHGAGTLACFRHICSGTEPPQSSDATGRMPAKKRWHSNAPKPMIS